MIEVHNIILKCCEHWFQKSIFCPKCVGPKEVAHYLGEIFTAAGAKVEADDTAIQPFQIAKFFLKSWAKTIIFANHKIQKLADGRLQPGGRLHLVSSLAGTSVRLEGRWWRYTSWARLTALRKYIRESGDLPVNITFIIEGRESALTDLDKYLAKHKKHLRGADLSSDGEQGKLEIINRVSWKFP